MKRDLEALADREHDVLVIGGGIAGACAAWEASRRGLAVALIDQGDFGHATSAHSLKVVHGGIRYLQHGDLPRLRESVRERRAFLRLAPHLVHPLPFALPTYGHGVNGKALLSAGLRLYDALAIDRNRGIADPDRRVPRGHTLSAAECASRFPALPREGLTGAGVFFDAQMYNPPRLVLAFLRSASESGAVLANYVAATDLLLRHDRVIGIRAADRLGARRFEVRGRVVINAAGPWAPRLLRSAGIVLRPEPTFSRDACFVTPRRLTDGRHALGVFAQTRDPDALLSRKARHLFLVPWRKYTVVGVWHAVHPDRPDDCALTEEDLVGFTREVNAAAPSLSIEPCEISRVSSGLVLFAENRPGARDLSYGKRPRIVDHAVTHGVEGLITSMTVRFTGGRWVGERTAEMVCRKLRGGASSLRPSATPLHGGAIERFAALEREAVSRCPRGTAPSAMRAVARNYGTDYRRILEYCERDPSLAGTIGDSDVLRAEVVHAAEREMAVRLADVVLRRTELGTGERPPVTALAEAARLMGGCLGWDEARRHEEIATVEREYAHAVR
ncbi:MAG: glycerol-3-phosphate dehydrogenase/oxidase [Gemmatimonadota bacterium]